MRRQVKLAERKVPVVCCLSNRFNPAVKFAEQLMRENRFGNIVKAVRLLWSRPQILQMVAWTWSSDGGVGNQQAIHHIDTTTVWGQSIL